MLKTYPYNREKAAAYAKKWAFERNTRYMRFDGIGGDCTSFVSQCLFAGGAVMNYARDVGWYYDSPTDRAAAWSGVPYLYNFLTRNRSVGPFAEQTEADGIETGDLIQLGDAAGRWYHSLFVSGFEGSDPLVTTHTFDAFARPLSSYTFSFVRYLHIIAVRNW